ncbi:MAG: hypothetical protein Q4D02_07375 [Clostridia bacterium]|nr:hypothetical protein [Clostridia bacterium]
MPNYIMIQMENRITHLLNEDFSSVTFAIQKGEMDSVLKEELKNHSIWCDQVFDHYELFSDHLEFVEFTAPLYTYNGKEKPKLTSESQTILCIIPLDYERAKTVFLTCKEIVTKKLASYFDYIYNSRTLDKGMSSTIHFNDIFTIEYIPDEYEKYIPKKYIKVYEWRTNLNSRLVLFIKKQDANGDVVKIKVEDQIKRVILEDHGEKLKNVAKIINASRIEIIS